MPPLTLLGAGSPIAAVMYGLSILISALTSARSLEPRPKKSALATLKILTTQARTSPSRTILHPHNGRT